MDAIKSVENEVDKVLRLFSTCRGICSSKIDQLIETVERSKQELINLTSRKYIFPKICRKICYQNLF